MSLLFDPENLPVPHEDGTFHSAKTSRVVELIREYSPRLDVRYIPRHLREPGDNAFQVVERLDDGRLVVALSVEKEEDFDERVLQQIYMADGERNDVNARLDAQMRAQQEMKRKVMEDRLAEAAEISRSMIRSNKSTYNFNGKKLRMY